MEAVQRLWTKDFVVLTAANFLLALTFYLLTVSIVDYAAGSFQVSYGLAGSLVTAAVMAALFAKLLFGGRMDAWGIKRSMLIGLGLSVLASCLYLVDLGFWFLFLARVVHGAGFGIATASMAAAAAIIIPAERQGEGIGYFSMAQALAAGIGPFVAIALMGAGAGSAMLFGIVAAASAVAVATAALVCLPKGEDSATQAPARPSLSLRGCIQVSALPLCLVMFLVFIGYAGVVSYIAPFAQERGLTAAASLYFVVYSGAILVTRPTVGRRVDRRGANSVLYVTMIALCTGFAVLAFSYHAAPLLASAALTGFGIGATQSAMQAEIARLTPRGELGRANSTFFMSMDLGLGAGSVAIGALLSVASYQACYLLLAVLALMACALYHLVHGRNPNGR